MTDTTIALTKIIEALTPLQADERRRTVDAAMTFLGEPVKAAPGARKPGTGEGDSGGDHPATASKWMETSGVTPEQLDQVFHFGGDGKFDILDAPGTTKKDQTLNTYILTGLGTYLATGNRAFDDATARGFCVKIGCYDAANHATHLKEKHPEFSGDKKTGYTLTTVGTKRGAALVKELAGVTK
jgi:hypothetical protein